MEEGIVIYWNGKFGFIKTTQDDHIFFHKSQVIKRPLLKLLSRVKYTTKTVHTGRHTGRLRATDVKVLGDAKLESFKTYAGILESWNRYGGKIKSPQLPALVHVNRIRKLYSNETFKPGSYVIFSPARDPNSENKLLATFAYLLERENDIEFLQKHYEDSHLQAVFKHLSRLQATHKPKTLEEEFTRDMASLGPIKALDDYNKFVELINTYKLKGFEPKISHIKWYCPKKFQIQLWEEDIIEDFDRNLIFDYFNFSNADVKRHLAANKFSEAVRRDLYLYHFEQLKQKGLLTHLNNHIKTFLDILVRIEKTSDKKIADKFIEHIVKVLKPSEIFELWDKHYIEKLDEQYIINHFSIQDITKLAGSTLVSKDIKHIAIAIFKEYLSSYNSNVFDENHFELIRSLLFLQDQLPNAYNELIPLIRNRLNLNQRFILLAYGIKDLIFDKDDVLRCFHDADEFYRLLFLKQVNEGKNNWDQLNTFNNSIEIEPDKLIAFAKNYKWNMLLSPTQIDPEPDKYCFFFLKILSSRFSTTIVRRIAEEIFNSIDHYSVIHLRLWIYNYVDEGKFDAIGFKPNFKGLTHEEKLHYKRKASVWQKQNLEELELLHVIPCHTFVEDEDGIKEYSARLENLYFYESYIILCKEDSLFTEKFRSEKASTGLNRIPERSALSKLNFKVLVQKTTNKIISIDGLEELYSRILINNIEKVLGKVASSQISMDSSKDPSYVEDIELKRAVIDYLNTESLIHYPPIEVYEPKNLYRRLDTTSGIDNYELTMLYTLRTDNSGLAIIWENLDFAEDRATYVFKTLEENRAEQINKIANAISSFSQLRSTLISDKVAEELKIFKRNLGYISSIRKQRGAKDSFKNWEAKLRDYSNKDVPELPSEEELELLKDWEPETEHIGSLRRDFSNKGGFKNVTSNMGGNPIKIAPKDIPVSPVGQDGRINPSSQDAKQFSKKRILEALIELNTYLQTLKTE